MLRQELILEIYNRYCLVPSWNWNANLDLKGFSFDSL